MLYLLMGDYMKKGNVERIEDVEISWATALEDPKFWDLGAEGGAQKQFHVTDEMLSHYYRAATELLHEKRWSDARDAFLFMTFLNPGYQSYWMGLGIAEQAQGQLQAALAAYLMAEALDATNPAVHANAFQCHAALEHADLAAWSYQKALDACGDKPEFADMKTQLVEYQKKLKPKR